MSEKNTTVRASVAEKLLGVSRSTVILMCQNGLIKSARKAGQKGQTSPWVMDRDEVQKIFRS